MITKEHRLIERDIRRVLKFKKPFFSYSVVANVAQNRIGKPRFGSVFPAKAVTGSVSRNFFRRRSYDLARPYLENPSASDVVIVPKKGKPLDHRDPVAVAAFENDVSQLYRKIFTP